MSNKGVIGNVNLNGETYSIASTLAAICSTSASAQSKTASVVNCPSGNTPTFTLIDGITISVLFENANTAQNPTLNINNSGAKPIYKFNTTNSVTWDAGTTLNLTYFAASGKTGWWVNGEYKESEQANELYKITVTSSNNSYSSDKDYEEILAAYNADNYLYAEYNNSIYSFVSRTTNNENYYDFNFKKLNDTGYNTIIISGISGHDPEQPIDTYTSYKYTSFYTPDFDDISFKVTATFNDNTWSVDKTYSQITTAYNTGKYIYLYYVNNDYDDCYLPLVAVDQVYHFESLSYYKYIHFEIYLDENNTTKVSYEEIPLVTDVQVNGTSILSSGVANLITNTAYNASSNKLATMSDIPTFSGVNDVKIDNSTIVSSGIANITTSTSHPYSSNNPLATIGDISAAGGGTVTSITAGTGLTGGTITSSGTIALDTSGVTAGTYQGLTVDTYGRVTSATNKTYSASEISYQPVEQGLQVENVCEALDDLYVHKADLDKVGYIKINNTNYLINGYQKTTVSGISGISISYGTGLDEIFLPDGIGFNTGVNNILSTVSQTYAPLASPALTGTPTAPTATSSTNTTQIATTEFVQTIKGEISSTIPTKVSDLTNDSGFTSNIGTITGITMNGTSKGTSGVVNLGTVLTSYTETDPTVPAWAKASTKPTYTASEVGALSSTVPVNIGDSLYLRGTGLWRSTETANADRIITTVNSGKDLMINADSTKTDANTGIIYLGYTNTTAVNIGASSSDVALKYNGSAVFSNSYTSPSVYSSRCTITNGGYMQIGKWVIVNLYITIDTTLNANTNSLLIYDLPEPEFSMSLSASATAPGTVKGLNSFIRKHTTSGATKGEICICSTSGLASGNVALISGIYTVS